MARRHDRVRHPTDLPIASGVIGGNVWLTESVSPGSELVVESPRTPVRQRGPRGGGRAHFQADI